MGRPRGFKADTIAAAKALGISAAEAVRVRQQVNMALCNCGTVKLYWLPRHRKIATRALHITRAFRLPDDAVLVGQYAHGINAGDVLGDLADLLAQLESAAPASASDTGSTNGIGR